MVEQLAENEDVLNAESEMEDEDNKEHGIKFLTFRVDSELFGTEIDKVQEIIEYGMITTIPISHESIRGVINLRGNVVPVVDLAKRIGKQSADANKRTCIIMVEMKYEDESIELGFVVDEINEVLDIEPEKIAQAPAFGADIPTNFIQGILKIGEGFTVLLDLDEVLSIKELADLVSQESEKD